MSSGHFNMDQMYGFKIKDYQLFFPQAYGTEFNYSPSLDLSADNLSDKEHIPGIQNKGYSFRLTVPDVYWKQDWGLRVLYWWPRNFYLIIVLCPWFFRHLSLSDLIPSIYPTVQS